MYKLHKNQQGIIHHIVLIILAVVVVAGIGFAGYKVYQAKYGIKAKANFWSILVTDGPNGTGHPIVMACKIDSGTKWIIQYQIKNPNSNKAIWKIRNLTDYPYPVIATNTANPGSVSSVKSIPGISKSSLKYIASDVTFDRGISLYRVSGSTFDFGDYGAGIGTAPDLGNCH